MTTMTTEPTTATITGLEPLGDGNWEIQAENGTWTITADTAEITSETAYHVEGPNHHFEEIWADSLADALAHVRIYGVDRRVTQFQGQHRLPRA